MADYDFNRDQDLPQHQSGQAHTPGSGDSWRGTETRSFGRDGGGDDARTGYGQYSREDVDQPRYGGQGAYGQGRGPGGYGYGAAGPARGGGYPQSGQGGSGPVGGGYGARDAHQGRATYGQDDFSRSARRSESRDGHDHEPHYRRWHDEQMRAHDRDYARWREDRSQQYHQEYGAWRDQRREAFGRDFDTWRGSQGQASVQDVTDGGDGSHHDKHD